MWVIYHTYKITISEGFLGFPLAAAVEDAPGVVIDVYQNDFDLQSVFIHQNKKWAAH